jgi:hypothetical protein
MENLEQPTEASQLLGTNPIPEALPNGAPNRNCLRRAFGMG